MAIKVYVKNESFWKKFIKNFKKEKKPFFKITLIRIAVMILESRRSHVSDKNKNALNMRFWKGVCGKENSENDNN